MLGYPRAGYAWLIFQETLNTCLQYSTIVPCSSFIGYYKTGSTHLVWREGRPSVLWEAGKRSGDPLEKGFSEPAAQHYPSPAKALLHYLQTPL